MGVTVEIAEGQDSSVQEQGSGAGYHADLLFALGNRCAGCGRWPVDDKAVEGFVGVTPVVHPGHGFLARVAALFEAYGAFEDTRFGGKIFGCDIRTEPRNAGRHAGGLISVGAGEAGPGIEEVFTYRA